MAIGLQSNQITFIDLTDSRVLNVNIACNLPTTQIHDTSNNTYTPNWSTTPLQLTPQIYLGSTELKAGDTGLTVKWQRQEGTDEPSILVTGEVASSSNVLTVSQNKLSTSASGFITYICTVTYDGIESVARVSFNLTSTGANGVNAITFQLYAPNGYILSKELDSLTLEAFAYDGHTQITTDAEYVWSKQENNEWIILEGQTEKQIIITSEDVLKSNSYKCKMTYKGIAYFATASVQDKNDTYNSVLCISRKLLGAIFFNLLR